MKTTLAVLSLAALATPSMASSPDAWAALDQRVVRACIAMSGLARPQVLKKRISYSDVIGIEVRMIRGTDNKGRMQRLLCAYNRSSGRTEVQEAGGWFATTTKP